MDSRLCSYILFSYLNNRNRGGGNNMPTLFFMRHTESEANRNRILASQTDVPLTPQGMESETVLLWSIIPEINRNFP